jgi:hypothetical protein
MPLTRLALSEHPGAEAWAFDGHTVFSLDVSREDPDDYPKAFPSSAPIARFIAAVLSQRGQLYSLQGQPILRHRPGQWLTPTNPDALAAALSYHTAFALRTEDPTLTNRDTDGSVLGRLSAVRGLLPFSDCGRQLAQTLQNTLGTEAAPVAGLVRHPYAGQSGRRWLVEAPSLPEPDPTYPHLRRLFSGLDLDPASHAALHVHLLGCLHALSLDGERPILLVDSWVRARGKSEVSKALAALLDGRPAEFSQSNRDSLHDEIIAHLGDGQRCFALDNIDGRRAYNNPLLCSLSTGEIKGRKKYASANSVFVGTVIILNTVYGAASFHRDLLSRCLRCELRGPAHTLSVRPQLYAPTHRLEILAEALHALDTASQYIAPTTTRFTTFELTAAAAYCHVFGLAAAETHSRLEAAALGARALLPLGPPSLHVAHAAAFDGPHEAVIDMRGAPAEDLEGATALGYTFREKIWRPLDKPPEKG